MNREQELPEVDLYAFLLKQIFPKTINQKPKNFET